MNVAIIPEKRTPILSFSPSKRRKGIETVADFDKWLYKQRTDINYEFYYGHIIKKEGVKQEEIYINQFLIRRFAKTKVYQELAILVPEADTYVDDFRKRIPDISYYTQSQIRDMKNGIHAVPAFAIEILSNSESYYDVEMKVQDYFDAGVQLVWYILPISKKIHIYTSPDKVTIHSGKDICTASPVIEDFTFLVEELFA